MERHTQDTIQIEMVNLTEEEICSSLGVRGRLGRIYFVFTMAYTDTFVVRQSVR